MKKHSFSTKKTSAEEKTPRAERCRAQQRAGASGKPTCTELSEELEARTLPGTAVPGFKS